jgi:hypothetical protein
MTLPLSAVRSHAVDLPVIVTCSFRKRAWLLIHRARASLACQAVAHGIARGFAFDREVKLTATAGGVACH